MNKQLQPLSGSRLPVKTPGATAPTGGGGETANQIMETPALTPPLPHRAESISQRRRRLLLVGVLLGVLAGLWPLRGWLERGFLTDSHSDTTTAQAYLHKMWHSPHLYSRRTAMEFLLREMAGNPALFDPMASAVLAGTQDGDAEVRALALAILAARKHPELPRLAEEQLLDLDPAVRLLGLKHLAQGGTPQTVPVVMGVLDDTDERVVRAAVAVVRRLAPGAKPPTGAESLRREVDFWHAWWAERRGTHPEPRRPAERSAWHQTLPDFSLEDIDGRKFQLADFQGRVVLIQFFDLQHPTTRSQLTMLRALQKQAGQGLAVAAILVETNKPHDCEKAHTPEAEQEQAEELAKVRLVLKQLARELGVEFPLLLDPHEEVINRLEGRRPPVRIWIDGQGRLRRRSLGEGAVENLFLIFQELERSPATAAQ